MQSTLRVRTCLSQYFILITAISLLCMFGGSFLAALVPQWIVFESSTSQSIGIFKTCTGQNCQDYVHPVTYYYAQPGLVCQRAGSELQDRLRASAAFIIGSMLLHVIVLVFAILGLLRIFISETGWIVLTVVTGIAAGGHLIGLMLPAITFNHWMFCGVTLCNAMSPTTDCGWGFSFVCGLISAIGSFAVFLTFLFTLFNFAPAYNPNLRFWTAVALGGLILTGILEAATPHWMAWNASRTSVGLFRTCTDTTCRNINWPSTMFTRPGCTVSGDAMHDRMNATAAMLFIASIGFLVGGVCYMVYFFIPSLLKRNNILNIIAMCLIFFLGTLVAIALIVYYHSMNSYLKCGQDYCEGVPGCGYGFSFALGIMVMIGALFLFFLHLWEYNTFCWCFCGGTVVVGSEPVATTNGSYRVTTTTTTVVATASSGGNTTRTVRKRSGKVIPLPAGDWVYDEESGYYWSDQRNLFWDAESEMYYNPNTEQWFR
jgi:hypothetical protein